MTEGQQQLCSIGSATIQQRMRHQPKHPKQVPLPVKYAPFEDSMRQPSKRKRYQYVYQKRMAVAAMNLQLQYRVIGKKIEENIQVRQGVGNGSNEGCLMPDFLAERHLPYCR